MLHSSMRTHSSLDQDATCLKNTNLCPLSHDATIFIDLLIDRIHPAHLAAVRVVKSNGVPWTNQADGGPFTQQQQDGTNEEAQN